MIPSRERIELALLAGMLAKDALSLLTVTNKPAARIGMSQIVDSMMKLDRAIKALPSEAPR